jgi:nucleoside transporter
MAETPDDSVPLVAVPPPDQTPIPPPVSDDQPHAGVLIRSLVGAKLSVAMLLHNFSLAAWIVTLSSYIKANTGEEGSGIFAAGFVGVAYGAGPLGGMIAPFLTGLLADHFFATERMLAVLHLLAAGALAAAVAADSQMAFYLSALAYFLCFIPASALIASVTFHHLARPERDFPIARAWGTGGWVAAGLFVGWIWPTITGDDIEMTAVPMKIAVVAELITAAFCLFLPHTPPANNRPHGAESGFSGSQTFALLREPRFITLMALAVLAHAPAQFYYAYLNVYLNTWIDWSNTAAKMTLGQLVEIVCMLLLPAVLLRVSIKTSILIGLAVWTVRLWMISASASMASPGRDVLLYAAILVHGVAFTMVTIALQMDVDRCAGRRRRATAQGLLAVAMSGMGSFLGAELSGMMGARLLPIQLESATADGWRLFWLVPTGISAGVWLLAALFLQRDRQGGVAPRG